MLLLQSLISDIIDTTTKRLLNYYKSFLFLMGTFREL